MGLFDSNSNKSKSNTVNDSDTTKDQNNDLIYVPKKKIGGNFIVKDAKSSLVEVVKTYWFPTFKNGLVTGIKKFVDYVFTGTTTTNSGGNTPNYYGSFFTSKPTATTGYNYPKSVSQAATPVNNNNVDRFRGYVIPDFGLAAEALTRLIEYLSTYGVVSVGEFWEFVKRQDLSSKIDYDWGWKNLNGVTPENNIETVEGGYRIVLPKLVSLT